MQDEIRYTLKKVENTKDKVFILVQVSGIYMINELMRTSLGNPWGDILKLFRIQKRRLSTYVRSILRIPPHQPHSKRFNCHFRLLLYSNSLTAAAVEVAIVKKSGGLIKYGLEVLVNVYSMDGLYILTYLRHSLRFLAAKSWEDRPFVLRQVEHIGEKSYVLVLWNLPVDFFTDFRPSLASKFVPDLADIYWSNSF
jgi:hypothetical protein